MLFSCLFALLIYCIRINNSCIYLIGFIDSIELSVCLAIYMNNSCTCSTVVIFYALNEFISTSFCLLAVHFTTLRSATRRTYANEALVSVTVLSKRSANQYQYHSVDAANRQPNCDSYANEPFFNYFKRIHNS